MTGKFVSRAVVVIALLMLTASNWPREARALLVSHWYVDSDATVALIKGAFAELKANPKLGRAEALRRSMLTLIDGGNAARAHPAAWAPFVVVGEGAAVR
jgi:CHAT domain-containing protein